MPLYVTEYERLARSNDGPHVSAGQEPAVANQKLVVSAGSNPSTAFAARTSFVMIHATEACHLAFGDNPVASDSMQRLGAGETRFYGVSPGHRVAVITGI